MDDVLGRLRSAAAEVLPGEPVQLLYLFGSRARCTARPGSDTDVAALLDDDVPGQDYLHVQLKLTEALSSTAQIPDLDLVVLNDAPLPLRGRVIQEGVAVYSTDESVRAEYESRTFREFGDYRIWVAQLDAELLARHASGDR